MRRGWMLALLFVALALGGGLAWWWSTPGQAWWMTEKWEWWVKPMIQASPGRADQALIVEQLNPQWDRLIRRGYLVPYCREWKAGPTETQENAFFARMIRELGSPLPPPLMGGTWRSKATATDDQSIFRVELLVPADQQPLLSLIVLEELGSAGEPLSGPIHLLPPIPSGDFQPMP